MKSVAWALQISSRWGGGRPRVMRMRGKQPLVSLGFCTSSSNPITHWTNNCALKLIYQILPFSEAIQCTLHQIPLRIGQIFALWNWSIKSVHFLMQFSVHYIKSHYALDKFLRSEIDLLNPSIFWCNSVYISSLAWLRFESWIHA